MKTKATLLSGMLILASITTFAQIDTFDLSKYKVADYKRHSLDFSLNSSSYTNVTISKYKTFKEHDRYDRFTSNLNVDYNYRLNTRKNKEFLYISTAIIPFNLYYQKEGNQNYYYSKEKQTNSDIEFNYGYVNSFYQPNNVFFRVGVFGNHSGSINKNSYESNINNYYVDNATESSDIRTYNSLVLGIGKGRIENVEDARMAVYILDDLIKTQSLTREPTEAEILELASVITQLKNKRFFDYRIRKIEEIQTIDTFLNRTGLITKADAVYFTTLNDNWGYSNNPIREAGSLFSFNLKPNYDYFEYRYSNYNPELSASKNLGLDITGEYLYAKPLNLQWQLENSLSIVYKKEKYWSNNYVYDKYSNDILYGSAEVSVGYYPNTRSFISITLINKLSKTWTDNKYLEMEDFVYNLNMKLDAYYYFSERLNINLSSDFSLYYTDYPSTYFTENRLGVNPRILLRLNYALF